MAYDLREIKLRRPKPPILRSLRMEKIVDWLIEDGAFTWFDGNGFAFIACCIALGFCVAIAASKKLRSKFF